MSSLATLTVASAQYSIDALLDWAAFSTKIQQWVAEAAQNNAQLLVFPEYLCFELTHFTNQSTDSIPAHFAQLQTLLLQFTELFKQLAIQYQVHIVAGTFITALDNGKYANRAYLFYPDGHMASQDKRRLTRFEREQCQVLQAAETTQVFPTPWGLLGIAICYDSEFPLLIRELAEKGATLIAIPSCTDTLAGYHRVQLGCRARALENQCFVIQSVTVGNAEWSATIDINRGRAGIFSPVDIGFPDDGILALGELDTGGWVYAQLILKRIEQVRTKGQVLNFKDW